MKHSEVNRFRYGWVNRIVDSVERSGLSQADLSVESRLILTNSSLDRARGEEGAFLTVDDEDEFAGLRVKDLHTWIVASFLLLGTASQMARAFLFAIKLVMIGSYWG